MTNDEKLMQKALEALEYPGPSWPEARHKTAVALRERLAQPADANPDPLHLSRILHELAGAASLCWTPHPSGVFDSQEAIKHVESAIAEIRDRLAQQMQEPVAWMWRCKPYCDWPNWSVSLTRPADSGRDGNKPTDGYEDIPLYTTPQPRQWVGLTDDEMHECWDSPLTPLGMKHARMIEAKLREKNT